MNVVIVFLNLKIIKFTLRQVLGITCLWLSLQSLRIKKNSRTQTLQREKNLWLQEKCLSGFF
jgi:hypothetical protein